MLNREKVTKLLEDRLHGLEKHSLSEFIEAAHVDYNVFVEKEILTINARKWMRTLVDWYQEKDRELAEYMLDLIRGE